MKKIINILNSGSEKEILTNLDLLAEDYLQKTGRKVCRTCPSDIQFMLFSLKNIYKMTEFRFKKPSAQYKNKKGDKITISNSTLTNERAVEFLKTDPKRIELFSEFPSNWKEMIEKGSDFETEEQKEKRLAAQAESKTVKATKEKEEVKPDLKDDLLKKSLKELREEYPNIKATSIKTFVEKIIKEEKAK